MKTSNWILLCVFFLLCISMKVSAQYNETWCTFDATTDYHYFIGSENMDNDAQKEIVILATSSSYDGASEIYILDGLSGQIEWNSIEWYEICTPLPYRSGTMVNAFPQSGPNLLDTNNDGKYELLFFGKKTQTDKSEWHLFSYDNNLNTKNISSQNIKIDQNYPNPFLNSTKIKFELETKSHVIIKIFDVNGNLIENLIDQELLPDSYEYEFQGSRLTPGLYFYQVSIGNKTSAKKMVKI